MKSASASRRSARQRSSMRGGRRRIHSLAQLFPFQRFRLTPFAIALGAAMGLPAASHSQQIVIDNRTATSLAVNGNVTNVTTATIVGNNAFNSFSKFDVNAGNTVNLHVPTGANALLNLISSAAASRIDGMLNAIKDGKIGGNVFLANPEGIIVGSTGVINVGSLSLVTPTHAFVDDFFDAGLPRTDSVISMINGTVPINAAGLIRVAGKINTVGDASLRGGNVEVSGLIQTGAAFTNTQVDFSDIVNTTDIQTGNAVIVANGKIQIVAGNDVAVTGTIATRGGNALDANAIEMLAGNDLTLGAGALLQASGKGSDSSGGSVVLRAGNDLFFNSGASILVEGGAISGDGGSINARAGRDMVMAGGTYSAAAPNGTAGTFLFSTQGLKIQGDLLRVHGDAAGGLSGDGITWNAGSITLEADGTIVIDENRVISTRDVTVDTANGQSARNAHLGNDSVGDSGDITISAKKIELKSGAMLLANATGSFAGGDITLNATDTASDLFFKSLEDQDASIDIHDAVLKGRNVHLTARADDAFEYTGNKYADKIFKELDDRAYMVDASISQAKASILLDGGTLVAASGEVILTSTANADASMSVSGKNGVGVGYGKSTAIALTNVADATIEAGGKVEIKAEGTAMSNISVDTLNREATTSIPVDASKYIDFALAISNGSLDVHANVGSQAVIRSDGNLDVVATGHKNLNVTATGGAYDDGTTGAGLALSFFDADIDAAILGKVTKATDVTVNAALDSSDVNNGIQAKAGSGTGALGKYKEAFSPSEIISAKLGEIQDALVNAIFGKRTQGQGAQEKVGIAASFLYLDQDNDVTARIGPQAQVTASGDVEVSAYSEDVLSYYGAATVDKTKLDGAIDPSQVKKYALSAAVAMVDLKNHTVATIGDNARVDAGGDITVSAHSDIPVPYELWSDWSSTEDWFDTLQRVENLVNTPTFSTLTGWTRTTAESTKLGVTGSLNFFTLENTADASIGQFARINTAGTFGGDRDVTVSALAEQGTINLAGVFGAKFFGSQAEGTGLGGGLMSSEFKSRAKATIGHGAIVRANDLVVDARTESNNIFIGEAGGKSSEGASFNGSLALTDIDNTTIARVDSEAVVSATGKLDISAVDDSKIVNVAGSVSKGTTGVVGVAIAIANIDRQTLAGIGEVGLGIVSPSLSLGGSLDGGGGLITLPNASTFAQGQALVYSRGSNATPGISGLDDGAVYYVIIPDPSSPSTIQLSKTPRGASVPVTANFTGGGDTLSLAGAAWTNGDLKATALSEGRLTSIAFAGTLKSDKDPMSSEKSADDSVGKASAAGGAAGSNGGKSKGKFGIGVSGAASLTDTTGTTEASLINARVIDAASVKVTATDQTNTFSLAGALAIAMGRDQTTTLAGAYSQNDMGMTTRAALSHSLVDTSGALEVLASNDGNVAALAAGGSISGRASGLAGSVTINEIDNKTYAIIDAGSATKSSSATVQANDDSDIESFAGAINYAGKGIGVGASVAINSIANVSESYMAGSDVETTAGDLTVRQSTSQTIDVAAVAVGVGADAATVIDVSVAINFIESTEKAYVTGGLDGGLQATGDIRIDSVDSSAIHTLGGGVAIGGRVGVGASGAYNFIANEVSAYAQDATLDSSDGSVLVTARSGNTIEAWGIGVAVSQNGAIAGTFAVADVGSTTKAWLDDADVTAGDSVAVTADTEVDITFNGGALAVSAGLGFGGTVGVNLLHGTTQAYITNGSLVDAAGNDAATVISTAESGTRQAHGVVVAARTEQDVTQFLVTGGVSNSAGIALTGTGSEATSLTEAWIDDGAGINGRHQATANAQQSVSVEASTFTDYSSKLGSLAFGGTAGVGATAAVSLVATQTRAYIDGAAVQAKDGIQVRSVSVESLDALGATVGLGGDFGLAGTIFHTSMNGMNEAFIRNTNAVSAGGDLIVRAEDDVTIGRGLTDRDPTDPSRTFHTDGLVGGAASASLGAALGGAVSLLSITNTTRAYMTDVTSDAAGATRVQASGSQEVHSALVGVAGAVVGASASVVVNGISTTTEAFITETAAGSTVVNGDTASASSMQDVEVSAENLTVLRTEIFSANIGAGAAGASVDVSSVRNGVAATIGGGVQVNARRDVTVEADSQRDLGSQVVAFGVGGAALQGAVTVYSVGGALTGDSGDAQSTSAGQADAAQGTMGFHGAADYADTDEVFAGTVSPANFGTSANIGANASVDAGNDISVAATDRIEMHLMQGGAVIAGLGGGAAVGVVSLDPVVNASIGAGAHLVAEGDVLVSASADIVATNEAYVAALGAGVISAAVSLLDSDAKVKAWVESGTTVESSSLDVSASRSNDQDAVAKGATIGTSGGVGASVAIVGSDGETAAWVGNGANLGAAGTLTITASNLAPSSGGNRAEAVAAAVGGLAGAAGAVANAESKGTVEAYTGSGVILPSGDVIITANRANLQRAEATGIAAGGLLAIGLTMTEAKSSGLTHAWLGASNETDDEREGNLLVAATALETNQAHSIAGSGGAVAGNGAEAKTTGNSAVKAEIVSGGAGAPVLHGGEFRVQAMHADRYNGEADSINAALVGASGSLVDNNLTSDAQALIGANVRIVAADGVAVGARNEFYSDLLGDSATGAAGGVFSGSAALSSSEFHSTTKTTLGADVELTSGTDPMSRPGGILLDASTVIIAADKVQLTTGGAITGAGTDSAIYAYVDNAIGIGSGSELTSQGNIAAGTYTLASLQSESRVSTWGLAGVGIAYARTEAYVDETVTVGAGADITAFGNVNLMAGDDPSGVFDSSIVANADAQSYVRGVIAVPLSYADSVIDSAAKLDIGAGAKVNSAQNVAIGAYNGILNANTNGEGHGFQLGFIPTESGNQGGGPRKTQSAELINNGDVTAGYYYRLNITIPECPTLVNCQVQVDPGGAPFDWSYDRFFNAPAFIDTYFGGAGAALIASGTSSTPVGAITLGTLFASGGNVTVNASSLFGSGSITAHGAPEITVLNKSDNYLILGNVLIPNTVGGRVQFTGGVDEADAGGMTIHGEPNQEGVIDIHNTAEGPVGNSPYGPALFVMGNIENVGGKVFITNDFGSLGQAATIFGKEVHVTIPEGVAVIDIPNGAYYAGGNPYSEWLNYGLWPGGTPGTGPGNANDTFFSMYPHTFVNAPSGEPGAGTTPTWFTYADCSGSPCVINQVNPHYASLPWLATQYNQADLSGSQRSSAIYGGKVLIQAKYIDINGGITIGTDTDWSLNLNASLLNPGVELFGQLLGAGEVARADWLYAKGRLSNPIVELGTVTADSGDSRVGVKYDAQNKRFILDDVKASSDGGSLVLDGRIISTNGLGSIHVNGGLGDVDIDNQTGLAVVVQDVYTGNTGSRQSVVSTVDITDRNYANSANHWVYRYTPLEGLAVYNGALGSSLENNDMSLQSSGGSNSRSYQPLSGLRWTWEQVAKMTNTMPPTAQPDGPSLAEAYGNFLHCCNWTWDMPVGQPNNPWQYVTWSETGAANGTSLTPTGKLETSSNPFAFTRQFFADVTRSKAFITKPNESQNFYFVNATNPGPGYLFYPLEVTLRTISSVKADNPISIDFSGSANSRVAINSVGSVSLTGTITNPGGPTTIGSGGSVTQAAGASIQTDSLVISATTGIGSSLQPIVSRLSPDGLVKAVGGIDGIFLDLQGGRIQEVVAKKAGAEEYGDVVIHAVDDLLPESGGTGKIVGANVTLSSLLGAVGSEADPIRMSAMGAGGRGGDVNVTAENDIHLFDDAAHDFRIGQLWSVSGDISVQVPNGSIQNASEQTSAQVLSEDQVQKVWTELKLLRNTASTTGTGAEVRGDPNAPSVKAFETRIEAQYGQYWGMVGDGTVVGGKFVLNGDPATQQKYAALAQAEAESTHTPVKTAQQFAEDRYAGIAESFTDNIGTDWQERQEFQQNSPAFQFVATQDQVNALTHDSGWTREELDYSVSEVALQSSSAPVGSGEPNLIGRDVRLVAGGSVGRLADPVVITLDEAADGTLTNAQKAALALAKAPGDVVRLGTDADGNFVTYQLGKKTDGQTDYDSIPQGITAYGFRIVQTSPVFVEMTGALQVETGDAAFLQGTTIKPTLNVDYVHAGGTVGLVAPDSIVAAVNRSQPNAPMISSGTDMRLTAGTGTLGASGNALTVTVGGKLVSATAGSDVYLAAEGNLTFDRIFAGGQAAVSSNNGILLAGAEGVGITARNISLAATGGSIGADGTPIVAQIDGTGALSASATGDAYVDGFGAVFKVFSFQAGGNGVLTASGDLEATQATSGGSIHLQAAGNLDAGVLASGGDARVEAGGSVAFNTLATGGGLTVDAGTDIAAGSMTSGGDAGLSSGAGMTFTALDASGTVGIDAGGELAAGGISGGDTLAITGGNASIDSLQSTASVMLQSGGDLRVGAVTAAGSADLHAGGYLLSSAGFTGVNVTADGITLSSAAADIGQASKYFVIEDLGMTNALAWGDIYLEQRNLSLTANLLASVEGSVNMLVTSGDASIEKIIAPQNVNVRLTSGGMMHIADLDPANATLAVDGAGGSIEVLQALVSQSLSASASEVSLEGISQVGGRGPLHLVLQGAGGGIANVVDANVISANDVTIDRLSARRAFIDADVSNLWIENARIVSFAQFSNESFTAAVDNVNRVRYDADLQLYAPSSFYLRFFADPKFETNALAIDYGDDFRVNGYGSGNSVTRFIPRLLALVGMSRETEQVDDESPESGLVTWSSSALLPADAITAVEQLEVNGK